MRRNLRERATCGCGYTLGVTRSKNLIGALGEFKLIFDCKVLYPCCYNDVPPISHVLLQNLTNTLRSVTRGQWSEGSSEHIFNNIFVSTAERTVDQIIYIIDAQPLQ